MNLERHKELPKDPQAHSLSKETRDLSHRILRCAHLAAPRVVFLQDLTDLLLDAFSCDAAELRLRSGRTCTHCAATRDRAEKEQRSIAPCSCGAEGRTGCGRGGSEFELLCRDVTRRRFGSGAQLFTRRGSAATAPTDMTDHCGSLVIVPLARGEEAIGLLILKSRRQDFFTAERVALAEAAAETISVAAAHQQAHAALRERVKELTCLYGISKILETPDISLDEILERIVDLLPPAWQYPEITHGRITLDTRSYGTTEIRDQWPRLCADIVVHGTKRGMLEVAYSEESPELDEGPFLREERKLIEALASQVARIMERRLAEEDRAKLQRQLRHADRLATIGQLAAGVAHEFNEPLGNILGLAELAGKHEGIPAGAKQDMEDIVAAAMHAREGVRKLMWFARELPAAKGRVNLNEVVKQGLYLLKARCAKAGIEVVRAVARDLPDIIADAAQLQQVLVNLVVNAIQAMPRGGTITIITKASEHHVSMIVEDTGIGMSAEVKEQIFVPFFTTKDVDEGTGLGLAVVHGIITAHGGDVSVESRIGEGSRFEIRMPLESPSEEGVNLPHERS
jgi:signal transduction histidine kinase